MKTTFAKRHVYHWTERDTRPRPLLTEIIYWPAQHYLPIQSRVPNLKSLA